MRTTNEIFKNLGLDPHPSVPIGEVSKVSKGVEDIVTKAKSQGIDSNHIGSILVSAITVAKKEGRKKLGMFGKGGEVLEQLTGRTRDTHLTNLRRNIFEKK